MKYALGLQEGVLGSAGQITQGVVPYLSSERLAFTYTRPEPAPAGVGYIVETSGDLVTWSSTGLDEIGNTLTGPFRTLTLRDTVDLGAKAKRFMRLRVTQP